MGEDKFDLDYVSEVVEWASCVHITGRCFVRLWSQIAGAICSGLIS